MTEINRVLLHPFYKDMFKQRWQAWNRWQDDPNCVVFGYDRGLDDVSYVSNLSKHSILRVGGQTAHKCVKDHLMCLAFSESRKQLGIIVQLSIPATWSEDLRGGDNGLYSPIAVINSINEMCGVAFNVVDEM